MNTILINKIKLDGAFGKPSWEGQTTQLSAHPLLPAWKHQIDTAGGDITESKLPLLTALEKARAQSAT